MVKNPFSDSASVLITMLMWMGGIAILTTTLLLVGIKVIRTDTLFVQQRQAYWLARGEARALVRSFANGAPDRLSFSQSYSFGRVEVQMVTGQQWDAKIVAHVADAVDTVTFSYSPTSRKIVEWRENSSNE